MPNPQASVLHVSPLQHELLEKMVHRTTNAQRLVKRGQIILEAAEGISNSKIAEHVQMDYETVRCWIKQLCTLYANNAGGKCGDQCWDQETKYEPLCYRKIDQRIIYRRKRRKKVSPLDLCRAKIFKDSEGVS